MIYVPNRRKAFQPAGGGGGGLTYPSSLAELISDNRSTYNMSSLPSYQADDIIVLVYGTKNDNKSLDNTTPPSGYTLIGENNGSGWCYVGASYKRATASESPPTIPALASGGGSGSGRVIAFIVRGCITSGSPIDVSSINTGSNAVFNFVSLTPTTTGSFLCVIQFSAGSSGATTYGTITSGYTEVYDVGDSRVVEDDTATVASTEETEENVYSGSMNGRAGRIAVVWKPAA